MQIPQFVFKLLLKFILHALVIICTSHQLVFFQLSGEHLSLYSQPCFYVGSGEDLASIGELARNRTRCVLFHPLPHFSQVALELPLE